VSTAERGPNEDQSEAKRLGGLGVGAEFMSAGSTYRFDLTSGTHFVIVDAEMLASQGKLISPTHVIFRALA
jgi:hypothetical protein